MPKLPRDCGAKRVAALLEPYGYNVVRQRGSHLRLHSATHDHSITIPNHDSIKVGTLSAILAELAAVLNVERDELIRKL